MMFYVFWVRQDIATFLYAQLRYFSRLDTTYGLMLKDVQRNLYPFRKILQEDVFVFLDCELRPLIHFLKDFPANNLGDSENDRGLLCR